MIVKAKILSPKSLKGKVVKMEIESGEEVPGNSLLNLSSIEADYGLSRSFIRRMIKSGELRAKKFGKTKGGYRVKKKDLIKLIGKYEFSPEEKSKKPKKDKKKKRKLDGSNKSDKKRKKRR